MDNTFNLTGFDFVIIALLFLFIVRGLWVGFLAQVTTLIALLAGYIVAGQYHDKLFPFLRGLSDNPQVIFWSSCAILFAITYVLVMLFGKVLTKVIEITVAGWFDKILGGILGCVKACVIIILLNMVLSGTLSPENTMLRSGQFYPYVHQGTEYFRSMIKDDTLRETFLQKKPAIAEQNQKAEKKPADGVRPFVPTESPGKE